MRGGKFLSLFLMLALLVTSWAFAGSSGQAATPAVSLEEAIRIAKGFFPVPAELSEFSSHYHEYQEKAVWWLNWQGAEGEGGEMTVQVDAVTGDVLSMYRWKPGSSSQPVVKLPKITQGQAEKIALELLEKLQPEKSRHFELVQEPDQPVLVVNPYGPARYQFYFQRFFQEIPFPANSVRIVLDGDTGEVLEYSFSWDQVTLQVPEKILDQAAAEKIFQDEFGMELIYFRPVAEKRGQKMPVKFVYRVKEPARVIIDAATGEIIQLDEIYYGPERGADGAGESMKSPADSAVPVLSPEEQKEVIELESLLTQEQSLEIAKRVLDIPRDYILTNASLRDLWEEPGKKVWVFSWRPDVDEYRGYLEVTMEAKTGEIVGFSDYRYDEEKEKQDPRYDREQAREIAEKFMKKLQPEKTGQVRLQESRVPSGEKAPRSHSFVFERMVDGIPFPQNGFNLTVDAVSGRVSYYRLQWSEGEFPRPVQLLGEEKAAVRYLEQVPLKLAFLYPPVQGEKERPVYLAYYFPRIFSQMIDGLTGEALDWGGKPIEQAKPAVFSDIADHPARQDIELLAAAGIVEGTEDGRFRPEDTITQAELAKMLIKAKGDRGPVIPLPRPLADSQAWYGEWMYRAVAGGLITEEEMAPEEPVSRERLAVMLIRHLGYEKPASLSQIYQLDFVDQDRIRQEYRGHVALACGFRLFDEGDRFNPDGPVSRAQAAVTLVRLLNLE
jgi:uncharacterized membrane protein YkoI